jgi:hypothetical protein
MYIRYDKPYSEWSYKIALVYARIATWLFSWDQHGRQEES